VADVEIIVLVGVGTAALLITLLRGPRPDPGLAAEPVSAIVRDVAIASACPRVNEFAQTGPGRRPTRGSVA